MSTEHDDQDIRTLIERGSSSWAGPTPSARRARWAAEAARPRRWMPAGLAAAGFGVAALIAGSVTFAATAQSPDGPAASVMRLVSHVFTTPPGAPPGASPAPPPPGSSPSAPPVVATASGSSPSAVRPARTPAPSPTRSGDDVHRPSPAPSPSGTAGPSPSPSPSRPPDE
jgi:eukaryotic-like serine/threonine-protein kinase